MKSAKRRVLITKIKNEKGEVITSRKGIANVFGEFYSKLYDEDQNDGTEMESDKNETENDEKEMIEIPEITTDELQKAIKRLKKGKAADSNGIRAEDIKACDEETKEMVRQSFNEIVKQKEFTPEAWRRVRIEVIHKKEDEGNVGNYRPICSLPALYKLLTTILYCRLYPRLDQTQAEIQVGFRSSHQTTDHLATHRMIDQKCHEWGNKMWAATIDFTKAFHSITHKSIWNAFKSCKIEHDYIRLLKKRYRDQKATVLTAEESDMFEIKNGTKLVIHYQACSSTQFCRKHWKRHSALAKEERNGNIPERQRTRLPDKHEIC